MSITAPGPNISYSPLRTTTVSSPSSDRMPSEIAVHWGTVTFSEFCSTILFRYFPIPKKPITDTDTGIGDIKLAGIAFENRNGSTLVSIKPILECCIVEVFWNFDYSKIQKWILNFGTFSIAKFEKGKCNP